MIKKLLFVSLLFLQSILADIPGVFTEIYDKGLWGKNREGEGISGQGSIYENVTPYMKMLEDFLHEHSIQSIVDVGCGDWELFKFVDLKGASYLGVDVVKKVIEKNKLCYEKDKVAFLQGNFIDLDLPKADLLICKDVLQHLSNEEILKFLPQIEKYTYCLFTNDVDVHTKTSDNINIVNGDYRTLDLTKAPFHLKGEKILTFSSQYTVKQILLVMKNQSIDFLSSKIEERSKLDDLKSIDCFKKN